jgi:hypothetical protein
MRLDDLYRVRKVNRWVVRRERSTVRLGAEVTINGRSFQTSATGNARLPTEDTRFLGRPLNVMKPSADQLDVLPRTSRRNHIQLRWQQAIDGTVSRPSQLS